MSDLTNIRQSTLEMRFAGYLNSCILQRMSAVCRTDEDGWNQAPHRIVATGIPMISISTSSMATIGSV